MAEKLKMEYINRPQRYIPYISVLATIILSNLVDSEFSVLIIFFVLSMIYIVMDFDSRILIGFALIILTFSSIEFGFGNGTLANTLTIYSFYYLVTGTFLEIIEYIKEDINIIMKDLLLRIVKSSFFIFFIFASIILIPILMKRYIFLLDLLPKKNLVHILDTLYYITGPIYGGTLFFSLTLSIVSPDLFQKIILFAVLFMSGYSIHGMINILKSSKIVGLFTGTLYMINPYIYIRIISGQWYLLFSYAILPLSIKSFLELLEKKERRSVIKFIFFISLVAFNIHMLIIALIIMIIIFIFWSLKYKDIKNIKTISITIIIFIFLNFYWIFPLMTTKNTLISNINEEDYKVFAPKIDDLSDLFNIAGMYGFWREGYIYAKDFIPYWQLLSIFIISLAVYGFMSYFKDDKIGYIVKALGVIGIIGFILATGINGPFGDINHWLYDNTILKGFRDSHKFVAIIVFSYAILGGLGIAKLDSMKRRITNQRL